MRNSDSSRRMEWVDLNEKGVTSILAHEGVEVISLSSSDSTTLVLLENEKGKKRAVIGVRSLN